MKKLVLVFALMLLACTGIGAQSRDGAVKYISENKLFGNDTCVTVTNIDMEWPMALGGDPMKELQTLLIRELLGSDATTLQFGWRDFRNSLGREISRMPDDTKRYYVDMKLKMLWYVPGKYVSMVYSCQKRNDTDILTDKRQYLTYDLTERKILTRDRVFRDDDMMARMLFEDVVEKNAVCADADKPNIDLTLLPKDFSLVGNIMILGLGGRAEHNNFSTVFVNDLQQLGMLNRKFSKWFATDASSIKRKKVADPTSIMYGNPLLNFDTSFGDTVYIDGYTAPTSIGGNDSLVSYIQRELTYPQIDQEMGVEGRVMACFIVETDGTLSNFMVLNPLTPTLNAEAVRCARGLRKMNPGKVDGRPVRSMQILPINFKLAQ